MIVGAMRFLCVGVCGVEVLPSVWCCVCFVWCLCMCVKLGFHVKCKAVYWSSLRRGHKYKILGLTK
jgi:hypothetical protein